MAENAIQIIIDVLAQEGVTSLDSFTKALSTAYDRTGTLSVSVDDLDASLKELASVTKNTDVMAAAMVATLEEFGIQVEDTDGLVNALSGALKGLAASSDEAAGGVDKASVSTKKLAGSADVATNSVKRQSIAMKENAATADFMGNAMVGAEARAASGAVEAAAAIETMGKGYARVATMAELGTPALMKAATWAGIGLAGLAYEGIKQYTAFNRLITQTITQAGEAPSKMGFLTNLAESVAKSTGQNLDDVANSIYRAASGTASWNNGLGATKKQLTDIVTQVSKLNVLGNVSGGAESEQASRVVTALINANIKGIGRNPAAAAALVNAAVGSGDMRLADLVPGIGRGVLQSAVANKVSAKDTFAWIADLTSTGTTASVAGNYVKTGINLLANPSAQGTDVLSMIGIKPGEMGQIMSGPGGLVSAAKTLKSSMNQLTPSAIAGYFFNTTGHVRAGGGGLQGAWDKLQTMSANELSPTLKKNWMAGTLTTAEKQQVFSLVLDKAYGGSKQFATIASILNNPGMLQNIEQHMTAQDSPAYLKASELRAENTPSQQFKIMGQHLLVDLVNVGKTLTPIALTFAHAMTGVIGGLSKFKGILYAFAGLAGTLLLGAGITKGAELMHGISPYIGAGYNRLGNMFGKNSSFTTKMESKANSGAFKFLNIYDTKKHGILSKIGGESISAGYLPGSKEAVAAQEQQDAAKAAALSDKASPGENLINNSLNKGVTFQEQTAANTRMIAEAMGNGGIGGGAGGGLRAAEKGGGTVYAPQFKDPVTGRFLSAAESAPLAARMSEEENAAQTAAMYYGATGKGRGIKSFKTKMMGGAGTAAENIASTEEARMAAGGVTDVAETGLADVAESTVPAIVDTAGSGMLAGLGEMAGGLMGGPVGMMAMMAAPMLMGPLMQLGGKLGSLLGSWLGAGSSKPYNPNVKNPLSVTTAAAKLAKATKTLRQFQTEHKNKAGKEIWSTNVAALLADPDAFNKAVTSYTKAGGNYHNSIKNANVTDQLALSQLFGPGKKHLSNILKEIHGDESSFSQQNSKAEAIGGRFAPIPAGELRRLRMIGLQLPTGLNGKGGARQAFTDLLKKNGLGLGTLNADFAGAATIVGKQKKWAQQTFNDASSESMTALKKHDPTLAAMITGGYFGTRDALNLNSSQEKHFLNDKNTTTAIAEKYLPQFAHKYHLQAVADANALKTKNLPTDARIALKAQEAQANNDAKKTDELIRTMRDAAKNTHLSGESVSKLAKEIATQTASSALPANIANKLGPLLNQYMKTSSVTGTGSGSTKTKPSYGGV
jgi:hypothetical protein